MISHTKGFTMVELLIVIAVAVGIFALSAPYGLNFYNTQLTEEAQNNIVDALQRARHYAVLQKNDSAFGVTLSEVANSYVIFQGDTYAGRDTDQDEVYVIADSIIVSGLTDVVFSKLYGLPSATGTITLTNGSVVREISISDSGAITKTDVPQ